MRNVVVCIPNALLAGGIELYLKKNSDFRICREESPAAVVGLCVQIPADVLLVEVRERSPHTIDEWNERVKTIKEQYPDCKAVYVVDENGAPDLADRVTLARRDRLIDAFLFGTVSGEYLAAVVDSL